MINLSFYIIRHTEGAEVKTMAQSCNGAKGDGGIAYRFLITIGINALGIKSLIKYANNLRRSTHRQCLRDYHCFV